MARRHGTQTRKTTHQILVRLGPVLAAAITSAASAAEMRAPAWIRIQLAKILATDAGAEVPTAHSERRRAPAPAHVLEVHRLREVVAELGGAMTVAAVQTREQGLPVLHQEIEALIPGIKKTARELDALKRALDEEVA